jgi:hypothetical protein
VRPRPEPTAGGPDSQPVGEVTIVNEHRWARLALAAALLLLIAPPQAGAQTWLGLKGGLNLATFNGDDAEGLESLAGLTGGAALLLQLSPSFALQPEVVYTTKGAKGEGGGMSLELKTSYLEIPVLFKFTPQLEGSTVHPALYAGPAIAFNLDATAEATINDVGGSVDIANAKSSDLGLVLGGGMDVISTGGGRFMVDVRYTLGMSEAFDDTDPWDIGEPPAELPLSDPDTGEAYALKHGVLSLTVGYGFPLGAR